VTWAAARLPGPCTARDLAGLCDLGACTGCDLAGLGVLGAWSECDLAGLCDLAACTACDLTACTTRGFVGYTIWVLATLATCDLVRPSASVTRACCTSPGVSHPRTAPAQSRASLPPPVAAPELRPAHRWHPVE